MNSGEAEWKTQYDRIIQDIANSNENERVNKTNVHKNELVLMRNSGLPVDNDLKYLGIVLGKDGNACPDIPAEVAEAEWKASYGKIMQDIANSGENERVNKANAYKNELVLMRNSGLPVDNDLKYLGMVLGKDGNVGPDIPPEAAEADWKARYGKVMQDIANSNVNERVNKANAYKNELVLMRDSGLPVDNDLKYLGIVLGKDGGVGLA